MSSGIYVAVTVAVTFAIALIAAFIYLKHKLRTPITKLKFSNKPWIKYSIQNKWKTKFCQLFAYSNNTYFEYVMLEILSPAGKQISCNKS